MSDDIIILFLTAIYLLPLVQETPVSCLKVFANPDVI